MAMRTVSLVAVVTILLVVLVDWRRGRTGFGKFVLTRADDPGRYWFALVAYLNVALVMFWLSQQLGDPAAECDAGEPNCIVIVVEAPR